MFFSLLLLVWRCSDKKCIWSRLGHSCQGSHGVVLFGPELMFWGEEEVQVVVGRHTRGTAPGLIEPVSHNIMIRDITREPIHWPRVYKHLTEKEFYHIIEGLPPMPPTPNRGDSKVGCGRSKQCLGDGRQVSGILQPFCVDAQPSGSIPTSQQQTDGQSCHPKNTKQPKVVESAAFQIVHDDATRIWESHCLYTLNLI